MKPRILVLYYTQSGQLRDILDSLLSQVGGEADFTYAQIEPVTPFPFPWPATPFLDLRWLRMLRASASAWGMVTPGFILAMTRAASEENMAVEVVRSEMGVYGAARDELIAGTVKDPTRRAGLGDDDPADTLSGGSENGEPALAEA